MALENYRKQADPFITPVAMKLKNVNPNVISWIGLALAFVAGAMFYFSGFEYQKHYELLLAGAIIVLVSGYFDALDGKIAKLAGKCSKKGDYLDHVFDRYADMFMIAAIALSGWCNTTVGLLAVMGVLLTSYMGTQAQAIGAKRLYDGLLGRADRVVLCVAFPIIQWIACMCGYGFFDISGYSLSWMEIMMIYFAVVGNLTAIQRVLITWKNLGEAESEEKKE